MAVVLTQGCEISMVFHELTVNTLYAVSLLVTRSPQGGGS